MSGEITQTTVIIVLSFYSLVSRIALITDALGYNSMDTLSFQITAGERAPLTTSRS